MFRSVFLTTRILAVLGTALITLAMVGCGTMTHPMSDDAQSA